MGRVARDGADCKAAKVLVDGGGATSRMRNIRQGAPPIAIGPKWSERVPARPVQRRMSEPIANLEATRVPPPRWLVAPFLRSKLDELEDRRAERAYDATDDLEALLRERGGDGASF